MSTSKNETSTEVAASEESHFLWGDPEFKAMLASEAKVIREQGEAYLNMMALAVFVKSTDDRAKIAALSFIAKHL